MTAPPRAGRTWIKICGITSVDLAETATDAGADAIGLVFAPKSPRCIDQSVAEEIVASLPDAVTPVGLFQNPAHSEVSGAESWPRPWIQLHGHEDETFIAAIEGHHVIRGFRFDEEQVRRWDACDGVDVLLIDGSSGGGGTSFEHERLAGMMDEIDTPVVIAGGLTPENAAEAIRTVKPYGVDVSSGVESSRGVKDHGLIRAFCAATREA